MKAWRQIKSRAGTLESTGRRNHSTLSRNGQPVEMLSLAAKPTWRCCNSQWGGWWAKEILETERNWISVGKEVGSGGWEGGRPDATDKALVEGRRALSDESCALPIVAHCFATR